MLLHVLSEQLYLIIQPDKQHLISSCNVFLKVVPDPLHVHSHISFIVTSTLNGYRCILKSGWTPVGTLWHVLSLCCSCGRSSYWMLRQKLISSVTSSLTFLLWIPPGYTLIGLLDTPIPPVDMNGSLCFSLHSLSASTVIFHKTQECLVLHCPTGFQPNKQQTVNLFFHSFPSHKMLHRQSSEAE